VIAGKRGAFTPMSLPDPCPKSSRKHPPPVRPVRRSAGRMPGTDREGPCIYGHIAAGRPRIRAEPQRTVLIVIISALRAGMHCAIIWLVAIPPRRNQRSALWNTNSLKLK
jgi:hypothetical protein